MTENELIATSETPQPEKQLTYEDLPPLLPQQLTMLNAIMDGDNYTDAYRKAGYKSEHAKQAAFVLVNRDPLKAHLDYFYTMLAKQITPEWITERLTKITEMTMDANNPLTRNPDTTIKAIAELNKMQGNYAQQTVQVNNVHASIDDVRNAINSYKKEC
jgi:phage terminase small subunit